LLWYQTFLDVPDQRFLTIRLTYTPDCPAEYEPPFFKSFDDPSPTYAKDPFTMKVGEVNTSTHCISLKVCDVFTSDQPIQTGI
jgi:hypothetical protein